MSKKWSSFGEQQLLTENWREFLTEEEVQTEEIEEGLFDRVKATAKGAYKGGKEAWEKSRPPVMSDYPATELTTIVNLISNAAKKNGIEVDTSAIIDQLEAMLKAQNFVIKEQGELMLGQELNLVLDQVPALKDFLTALNQKNPEDFKKVEQAFQRGGFKIGDAPVAQPAAAQQKQAQDDTPSAEPEQAQAAAPSEEPEQAQAATVRVSPEEYFSKMNLTYTDPKTEKNYNLQKLALKMAQALNSDLGINERREPKEFPAVVEFFKTVKNSGIKKVLFKALADYLKATNFQIGKETITTLRPELSRDSSGQESSKTTDNIKNILKKDFESEDFKTGFPKFADYDFDQQYAAFVSDLNKLVSKVNEVSRANMASALGVDKNEIVALAKKYPPIFVLIARHQPGSEGQKAFLSDLLAVATGKPVANKSDSGEPQQIDTTGASYAPTSGGLDAYSQGGEVEDIPSANQDKVDPDSIKMTADTARAQDLDAYSGDAVTTQDAEKEDKPAEEKPEKEKNTQSNEEIVKSELSKVFNGSDEEFDDAFNAFIKDLRKFKQLDEVGKTVAKDSMGITKTQYLQFEQKHQKIFDAINRVYKPVNRKNRAARQRFLKALEAISTTGSEEYYQQQDKERLRKLSSKDPSGEPFKTDREIEDRTGSTKDDSKTDDNAAEKTPKKQYKFPRLYQAPSTKKANQKYYSKKYQSGLEGKKYKFTGNIFNTTEEEYESIEKAYEKWRDLDYSMRGTPYIQAYLSGLQEYIENKAGQKNASQTIEDDSEETLNESTMVRWKELAGIL